MSREGSALAGTLSGHEGGGEANTLHRQGDYWIASYRGERARLRDSKGLRYVARLLRDAGRELHVAELARDGSETLPSAIPDHGGIARSLGDAGEILDARAVAEYRRRVRELERAISSATGAQAASLREEHTYLSREIAAARGLSGRRRRGADTAERVRKAVTNCIREAIRRARAEHPRLGTHLDESIRTGRFCLYAPREPVTWET